MTDIILVLVTAPTGEKAAELARLLVEEGLAACGNVVPGLRSIYRWEGQVQDEPEAPVGSWTPTPRASPPPSN